MWKIVIVMIIFILMVAAFYSDLCPRTIYHSSKSVLLVQSWTACICSALL